MDFYICSSFKERAIKLNRDFVPPTGSHSHFLFVFQGIKQENKTLQDNYQWLFLSNQLSLPCENQMANSSSKK